MKSTVQVYGGYTHTNTIQATIGNGRVSYKGQKYTVYVVDNSEYRINTLGLPEGASTVTKGGLIAPSPEPAIETTTAPEESKVARFYYKAESATLGTYHVELDTPCGQTSKLEFGSFALALDWANYWGYTLEETSAPAQETEQSYNAKYDYTSGNIEYIEGDDETPYYLAIVNGHDFVCDTFKFSTFEEAVDYAKFAKVTDIIDGTKSAPRYNAPVPKSEAQASAPKRTEGEIRYLDDVPREKPYRAVDLSDGTSALFAHNSGAQNWLRDDRGIELVTDYSTEFARTAQTTDAQASIETDEPSASVRQLNNLAHFLVNGEIIHRDKSRSVHFAYSDNQPESIPERPRAGRRSRAMFGVVSRG